MHDTFKRSIWIAAALPLIASAPRAATAAGDKKPEYPPFSEVSEGYH